MRSRVVFLMGVVLALGVSATAQVKSVTNAHIEQYRQNRLKGQQEYLDNYKRLGLPSPEELERRSSESANGMAELADKLRAEELERERIAAQRSSTRRSVTYSFVGGGSGNEIYSFSWHNRRRHFGHRRPRYVQPGYYAGGQFWPTGARTPSRPMFAPTRR